MFKLSTEVARELFLYGPAGGKRITSVKALAVESGASIRAINAHMPQWKRESENLASASKESGLVLSLSTLALDAHKSDCDFLRSEVDRLKTHLKALPVTDESYTAINRALLATERQWASMSGVMAALDAAACTMKQQSLMAAKAEAAKALDDAPAEVEPATQVQFKKRIVY